MRYRFYREHKYVCFELSEFDRLVAKTDFCDGKQIKTLQVQLKAVKDLLQAHAMHEDKSIHALLRAKGSTVHQLIESDHQDHEEQLTIFTKSLDEIMACTNRAYRLELGYDFYLKLRLFISDNLRHIHIEETVLMPELQRLYSDEELAVIDATSYAQMTIEQLVQMMEVLFPHMDLNDKAFFLADIKAAEPKKFIHAWNGIVPMLGIEEQAFLMNKLELHKNSIAMN
jgi:hemerythrin-like domain-containing protein